MVGQTIYRVSIYSKMPRLSRLNDCFLKKIRFDSAVLRYCNSVVTVLSEGCFASVPQAGASGRKSGCRGGFSREGPASLRLFFVNQDEGTLVCFDRGRETGLFRRGGQCLFTGRFRPSGSGNARPQRRSRISGCAPPGCPAAGGRRHSASPRSASGRSARCPPVFFRLFRDSEP